MMNHRSLSSNGDIALPYSRADVVSLGKADLRSHGVLTPAMLKVTERASLLQAMAMADLAGPFALCAVGLSAAGAVFEVADIKVVKKRRNI